jgi:hypothetical protein
VKSKHLVDQLARLMECTESVHIVMLHYYDVCRDMASSVEQGAGALEAFERAGALGMRQEITDELGAFETARHAVRVALFALAGEQGTSISDVGRALGISRQLASRLAAEAKGPTRTV